MADELVLSEIFANSVWNLEELGQGEGLVEGLGQGEGLVEELGQGKGLVKGTGGRKREVMYGC